METVCVGKILNHLVGESVGVSVGVDVYRRNWAGPLYP